MDINTTAKLNNNVEIPMLGLGTWESHSGKKAENAVQWAIEAGYRHIDTAKIYGNEESIGNAIKKSAIPRNELFITTKLWNADHKDPEGAFNDSLRRLQLDYVDLYLMHYPVPERIESWKILEKLYKESKCKTIGVSNFTVRHLKEFLDSAEITPAINQVEFTPFLYQQELLEFCRKKGIQLEAYSPLTRGKKLKDPRLVAIADNYGKLPAQVMIRWALQHKVVVIPKSVNKERIQQNADVFDFEISNEDMKKLDSFNENLRFCWNPTDAP